MQITIQEINYEEVRNGKNKYDKATVNYLVGGQVRTQNLVSFSNPAVFAALKGLHAGSVVDVTVGKNAGGYNTWTEIKASATPAASVSATAPAATAQRSGTWETPEERAKKQVLIVKQSSLSSAVDFFKLPGTKDVSADDVLAVAQQFTDWVFDADSPVKAENAWPNEDIPF